MITLLNKKNSIEKETPKGLVKKRGKKDKEINERRKENGKVIEKVLGSVLEVINMDFCPFKQSSLKFNELLLYISSDSFFLLFSFLKRLNMYKVCKKINENCFF